jgi:phospholipase/carboxylesterase
MTGACVIAGLDAVAVGDPHAPVVAIVLHGRQMSADDLAPFARAMIGGTGSARALPVYIVVPDAPLAAEPRGRTWWPVDSEARLRALAAGPLELSGMDPPGRADARTRLAGLVAAVAPAPRKLVIAGFSQGGMLAMDYALHATTPPDALALLSSTRIAIDAWTPRAPRLAEMPVLVAHGRGDNELAFAAGELLRDFAIAGGARVTWLPFDGGHELPLVVWRALRKLLRERVA